MRPPRAWCIALRASDKRLEDAAHVAPSPHRPLTHSPPHELVTITHSTLRRLTLTINLPGNSLEHAARLLGTTEAGLHNARFGNIIRSRYVPARKGKPIPVLSAPDELDPCAKLFVPADLAFDWTRTFLSHRVAPDFSQALTRVICYRDHNRHYQDKSHLHPEDPRVDPPPRRPFKRLPPPPPDYIQYKWKGDQYIGYDWKRAEKNPRIRINYERHERRKARQRAYNKAHPKPSTSTGSLEFKGWLWLCPHCNKTCRTVYLPVPPVNLLARHPTYPHLAKVVDIPSSKLQGFACGRCHNVRHFSRLLPGSWNSVIAYLTSGLLYGHEVERPRWWKQESKLAFAPRPNRAPSQRRAQVCELLLEGLTHAQIGQRLGLTVFGVRNHVTAIHRIERVHSLKELAQKLGRPDPSKREQIRRALNTGLTYRQAAAQLGYTYDSVRKHGANLRREQRAAAPAKAVIEPAKRADTMCKTDARR